MKKVVALVLVLAAAGCADPPTEAPYAPAEQLDGVWRWVSSLDVNTQELLTPDTEGFEAELRFTAVSGTEGTFTYRRSDGTEVSGTFGIAYEDAPGNDFIVLEPGIDFLERNAWLGAGPDTLRLGGVMELGYDSRYARVDRGAL